MNPVSTYFEQHILSADPVELIRLLYQKAISLVQDGRKHLLAGDIVQRSAALNRAYDILLELLTSLNDDAAPELCANLRGLYLYMQQRLLDANLQQQEAPLVEVLGLLKTLAEAWNPVSAPAPAAKQVPAANNPYAGSYSSSYSDATSGSIRHAYAA